MADTTNPQPAQGAPFGLPSLGDIGRLLRQSDIIMAIGVAYVMIVGLLYRVLETRKTA